jgi:hypothetical protein
MEIFRTDGGGKHLYDSRLMRVVKKVESLDKDVLSCVEIIQDHKGSLSVHLSKESDVDAQYIYSLFYFAWANEHEENIQILKDSVVIIDFKFNN